MDIYVHPEQALSHVSEEKNVEDQSCCFFLAVKTRLSLLPLLPAVALQASLLPDQCCTARFWHLILFGTMQIRATGGDKSTMQYIQNITVTDPPLAHSTVHTARITQQLCSFKQPQQTYS